MPAGSPADSDYRNLHLYYRAAGYYELYDSTCAIMLPATFWVGSTLGLYATAWVAS